MDNDFVMDITSRALTIAAVVSAPMLLGALVMGILVSLFQAVTQINEQTLTFIPKMLVIGAAMAIAGPWMLDSLTHFTSDIILSIPNVVAGR